MSSSTQKHWYIDPYPVPSHAYVRKRYCQSSRYSWEQITLPPESWRWRLRASAMQIAQEYRHKLQAGDVVLTTSMMNVAQLKSLLPSGVSYFLYMHENQLTYARPSKQLIELAIIRINSMQVAQRIFFNSKYHQNSFFQAMEKYLRSWPTDIQDSIDLTALRAKSDVVYPGIDVPKQQIQKSQPPLILWNHRWCIEKNPQLLYKALVGLRGQKVDFRLAVVGSLNELSPPIFEQIQQEFSNYIIAWGFQESPQYQTLLQQAQVVLSTANEENFGIGVLEAVAQGALPILPAKLSYPELYPTSLHKQILYSTTKELIQKLQNMLTNPDLTLPAKLQEHLRQSYSWSVFAQVIDNAIEND